MAEDFGDSTGSGLVNTAGQAAKEVVQAVVTKGAGIGGKGGGGISLSGEAKDMMAASKQLAGASAAPSREHLVAKPDLSREIEPQKASKPYNQKHRKDDCHAR